MGGVGGGVNNAFCTRAGSFDLLKRLYVTFTGNATTSEHGVDSSAISRSFAHHQRSRQSCLSPPVNMEGGGCWLAARRTGPLQFWTDLHESRAFSSRPYHRDTLCFCTRGSRSARTPAPTSAPRGLHLHREPQRRVQSGGRRSALHLRLAATAP